MGQFWKICWTFGKYFFQNRTIKSLEKKIGNWPPPPTTWEGMRIWYHSIVLAFILQLFPRHVLAMLGNLIGLYLVQLIRGTPPLFFFLTCHMELSYLCLFFHKNQKIQFNIIDDSSYIVSLNRISAAIHLKKVYPKKPNREIKEIETR